MTKKNRLNVSLDAVERDKLEKLAEESGLSLSRTIAQLIRKAKSKPMPKDEGSGVRDEGSGMRDEG